ncbi:KxYKxGKxW signal peptide domain-containing protein, partial [Furfurilactobacillus entadae]|uniref:KxYKxGKxW signal peptide domain-containing protein n=1 Tax=Furfurilactobacillus entadae TaxID=2922307 RepID=UPI0038B3FD76
MSSDNRKVTRPVVKSRVKMFKSKKGWLYAPLFFIGTAAALATGAVSASADTTSTPAASQPQTETVVKAAT